MSSVDNEYYEYLMSQDKSDLAIEIMNLDMASSNNRIAEFIKENDQLKQQLAEKDKEIEKLNACVDFYKSYYISFKGKVIDELEKVKKLLGSYKWYQGGNEYSFIDDYAVDWSDTVKIFDNQINELKESCKND